jgi:hypothetical protein
VNAAKLSLALALVAAFTTAVSFFFWHPFARDTAAGIGNLRGTALTLLVLGVPLLATSVIFAVRGSLLARVVWLGTLAYFAYNAVMFCFAAHFNSYFLLYTTLLAFSFWSIVTLLRAFDVDALARASAGVPARASAVYLIGCAVFFAFGWLQQVVPATLAGTLPAAIQDAGLTQNTVWVLDFAFTFPLMVLGGAWLWMRKPWGYAIGGMMIVMLTIETFGVAVDQAFGRLHDPSASVAAIPLMLGFTAIGLAMSSWFLHGIDDRPSRPPQPSARPSFGVGWA